ncbi:MAG: hypothetical protein P1Q69_03670 [Candidatus Thorarchaeota archaeon]|nr:hypothetical protein [Candidatus Thorarchaeota archaeon]
MMRIGKVLITIGLILLAASLMAGQETDNNATSVERGEPSGVVFGTDRSIHVEVYPLRGNSTFSMYLLYGVDANNTIVKNRSITLVEPLETYEDLTSFNDTLVILQPGIYALVFTTESEDYLDLHVTITRMGINPQLTNTGIILTIVGIVLHAPIIVEHLKSRFN